jgi:hypothetical protein
MRVKSTMVCQAYQHFGNAVRFKMPGRTLRLKYHLIQQAEMRPDGAGMRSRIQVERFIRGADLKQGREL